MHRCSQSAACAALILLLPAAAAAQSVSAPKTGERVAGNTKTCIYSTQGVEHTRTIDAFAICPISIAVRPSNGPSTGPAGGTTPAEPGTPRTKPATMIVVKTGEQAVGTTTRCYYEGEGRTFTRTVKQNQPCPPSITIEIPDRR